MKLTRYLLLGLGLSVLGYGIDFDHVKCGDPSRQVVNIDYTGETVPDLDALGRFNTVIRVPKGEKVINVATGDGNWQTAISDLGDSVFVKPTREGARTNIDLVTDKGNHYSFFITDRSQSAGVHPALLVVVRAANSEMQDNLKGKVKYVPADAVDHAEVEAAKATAEVERLKAQMSQKVESAATQVRSTFPASLKRPYQFRRGEKPFNVTDVATDGKLTYIWLQPEEVPALYEMRDGKESLVNQHYSDGLLTATKVLGDDSYLVVGKKRLGIVRKGS